MVTVNDGAPSGRKPGDAVYQNGQFVGNVIDPNKITTLTESTDAAMNILDGKDPKHVAKASTTGDTQLKEALDKMFFDGFAPGASGTLDYNKKNLDNLITALKPKLKGLSPQEQKDKISEMLKVYGINEIPGDAELNKITIRDEDSIQDVTGLIDYIQKGVNKQEPALADNSIGNKELTAA
ncbi:MAG: hypothetical protein HRT47_07280 [Candidatus Caenarcaniphilales bacterium]|nr:hypothetical protein [Candidatus Caenarcaniphilales bacterium]